MAAWATVAYIEPAVLRWARESAGYSTRRAADEIGVDKWYLELVEEGRELLSFDEAEKAAEVYGRSLAALFLPEPPDEESQEMQFRRLPGTPEPPWKPELQLTARRVTERQEVALEIYETLEESPPWLTASERLVRTDKDSLPAVVREALAVSRQEQASWSQDEYAAFRGWRTAVERLGVLVMQAGGVPVKEMRGFASIEPADVPAILVNNKDDPRARAFTVLHEFGHVVLARRGEPVGPATERWCESFAGRVLMPGDWLREEFDASGARSTFGRVRDVARAFHVTPLAAAVRITRAGLVSRDEGGAVIGQRAGAGRGRGRRREGRKLLPQPSQLVWPELPPAGVRGPR
jgi:Zn-dependent peptidase ImmA (M78 family)/transcriptional regulator with XRE-family HTH domain